jgi:hypothetical protein
LTSFVVDWGDIAHRSAATDLENIQSFGQPTEFEYLVIESISTDISI